MSIVNGCGEPNTIYDTFAASFASDALSTRVGAATAAWSAEVFNFADLPCPPPGVTLNPGQVYEPVFAPPGVPWDSLRIAHPDVFQACTVWEYSGWRDPPTALQTATEGVSGPEQPGRPHPPRLARAAPVTAYSTASAPMGTAEPSKTTARPSTTN